jgi:hypothetical protein
MSSQYQGDVMENLFDEGPDGQAHFDEEGFDEDGFEAEGFDEDGFDEEGFDEDGFDEDGFEEDGFDDEDTPDHGDAMEMAVADALDAENADEFLGSLFKKIGGIAKKVAPIIGKVARVVGPIASAIPLPMTQAIGGVANTVGGLMADEADEGEAFDGMTDFADEEDAWDAAAPVIAGLALRRAAPQIKTLPIQARRAAVKTATVAVRQLARRHGTGAVAAMPAIVHTARRHLAARRLPTTQLPAVIRKVAAHAHRNPRVLKTLVNRGRAMVGAGHQPHHRRHHRAGGHPGPVGYGTSGYSGGTSVGRGRRRHLGGGTRQAGGAGSYGSVGTGGGGGGQCAHCGRTQRLRFNGPIQLIIKQL